MSRIGIGLIGLGLAVKPHALALRDLAAKVDVIGAFSPTATRRAAFAATYGLPAVDRIEDLLGDARVAAVVILTPPRTHAELARRAAAAGKHVLLEKPVDVDLAGATATVEALECMGRTFGVVLQHRFRPGAIALREVLRTGGLGTLLSVSASVRWWRSADYFAQPGRGIRARDGGCVLLTQAIHTIDLLLDLAGPAAQVAAVCQTSPLRAIDTEDIACEILAYRSGAVGVLDATTTAYPGFPERIELAGTGGSALLEGERLVLHRHGEPMREVAGAIAGGGGADPMAFSHEPHRRLIEDFVDACVEGRQPLASGRAALAAQALIDAILMSSNRRAAVDVADTRTPHPDQSRVNA